MHTSSLEPVIARMQAKMAAWHEAETARKQRENTDPVVLFLRSEIAANDCDTICDGHALVASKATPEAMRSSRCKLLLTIRKAKLGAGKCYTARANLEASAQLRRIEHGLRQIIAGDAALDRTLAAMGRAA
jgi:hypothetical protein